MAMARSVMNGWMGFRGSTDRRSEEDQLLTDLPIICNSSTEKASMSGFETHISARQSGSMYKRY